MKKTIEIAKFTFLEVYRSKIMIGLIFIALAVLMITYIASEFAYGAPEKVALDFGIGIMNITNLFVSIFLGITLLNKEIESKTLYMILSRPISRSSFLIGKIIGLSFVLLVNTVFTGLVSTVVFVSLGGVFHNLIIWTCFFSMLEAIVIMLVAVLFSLLSNSSLAAMFTVFTLIASHTVASTSKFQIVKNNIFFDSVLKIAKLIIPDLERINTKEFLIYQQNLNAGYLLNSFAYILCYVVALLFLLSFIFEKKNLD